MNAFISCLLWLPAALWYRLIWSFSAQTATVSGGVSTGLLHRLLTVLCSTYDSAASHIQIAALELLSFYIRKGAHMFLYFVLALLVWMALHHLLHHRLPCACVTMLLCALLAALDEYHQTLVPGRSGELRDVLVDLGGVTIALILLALPALTHWVRQNLTCSDWLWPIGLLGSSAALFFTAKAPLPPAFFTRRAAKLEFFISSDNAEHLLQATFPILQEGFFLFLAAVLGFFVVFLSLLSVRTWSMPTASVITLLPVTLITFMAGFPLLPVLLLTLCAMVALWLLRLCFPLLAR